MAPVITSAGTVTVSVVRVNLDGVGRAVSAWSASSAWGGLAWYCKRQGEWGVGVLCRFFLFFLASAIAAGLLVRVAHASDVDLGMAEGSEGIVVWGVKWLEGGGWE